MRSAWHTHYFYLGLPVNLINKILGGYQQLQIANYFSAAGAVLSLLGNCSHDIFTRRPGGTCIRLFRISIVQQHDLHAVAVPFL